MGLGLFGFVVGNFIYASAGLCDPACGLKLVGPDLCAAVTAYPGVRQPRGTPCKTFPLGASVLWSRNPRSDRTGVGKSSEIGREKVLGA